MTDDNDSLIRGVSVVEEAEVPPDALHVDGENPNEQSDETFGLLVDSIRDGAWLGGPIIVNRGTLPGYDGDGDGLICDGEHRWRAAQEAGRETVPVKFCEFRHDAVRRYYRLHLNKVSGEHDTKRDALEYDHLLKEGHSDEVEALTDAADEDLDELLAELRVDSGVGPEYEYDPDHNVYFEDCVEGIRERLKDDSVDCMITDPPYGVEVDITESQGQTNPSQYGEGTVENDTLEEALEVFSDTLGEVGRVLSEDALVYVFASWKTYPEFVDLIKRHGYRVLNCLVWVKSDTTPYPGYQGRYQYQHEFVIVAGGDDARCVSGDHSDVMEYTEARFDDVSAQESVHPTQNLCRLYLSLCNTPPAPATPCWTRSWGRAQRRSRQSRTAASTSGLR